jgi:DUF4097 and DUF4098 domain-containing protein YvlB
VTTERLRLHVRTRSGRVSVVASDERGLTVEGANIEHEPDGSVLITGAKRGANRVELTVPIGSDLVIGTLSGHVTVRGEVGDVRVTTASGRVDVERAARVDVRTASGHVTIGTVESECRVVAKSARVDITSAGAVDVAGMSGHVEVGDTGDAQVRTMSGRVELGARHDGRIDVRTLSGKVEVTVPSERQPATQLRSLSGRIRCECANGNDGRIDVATTSGSINIACK